MKIDIKIIKNLESIIEQELVQYTVYLETLRQEHTAVVSLQSDVVTSLSEKRSKVMEQIAVLKEKRQALIAEVSARETIRLSEFVERISSISDKKRLLSLVKQLKEAIALVDVKSKEFNLLLNFSLGLVNGEISLLWSASQTVSRVYNAFGSIAEGAQPAPPRAGSLLGQA